MRLSKNTLQKSILLFSLSFLLFGCFGEKISEAELFIAHLHQKMTQEEYSFIYEEMTSSEFKNEIDKESFLNIMTTMFDDINSLNVVKGFGFNLETKNGITTYSRNYIWKGNDYNIQEEITIKKTNDAFYLQLISLNVVGEKKRKENTAKGLKSEQDSTYNLLDIEDSKNDNKSVSINLVDDQEVVFKNKENFVKVFCPEYPAGSIKVHCSGCSTFSRDQENIYKIGVNNKAKNIIISV
mgnify:CR=1 FL=1